MLGDCMLRRCALRGFGVVDCVDVERVFSLARSVEVREPLVWLGLGLG